MPVTIKANWGLGVLENIDYISDAADAEGYGRTCLDPAIRALFDYKGDTEYYDDDDIEITLNYSEKANGNTLKETIVTVNGKEILHDFD